MLSKRSKKKFKSLLLNRVVMLISVLFVLSDLSACLGINTHVKGIEPGLHPATSGKYETIEPVEIEVSSFKLFWFIPVTPDLKIVETVNDAVYKKGGDNLIEMQLWHERQYWILGTVDIVHVKGKIVRYPE